MRHLGLYVAVRVLLSTWVVEADLPQERDQHHPFHDSFYPGHGQCKLIPFEACKDVGYNLTSMPNLVGIELESEAEYSLGTFKPLVKFGCSSQLQFLLCAFYAPMCTPKVPTLIGPCRPLCEGVRDRCAPVLRGFGYPWPSAFNCSLLPPVNNEHHMCMEGPEETVPLPHTPAPPPTPRHTQSRCAYLAQPQLHAYLNSSDHCAPLCGADVSFSGEDKVFAGVWMAIWGVATFCVGVGALATLLLDASLFRYPDRAASHVCFCYALVAAGYLVRLGAGGGMVACRKDPELGVSVLITEGALSTPCVAVFLLLYYFSLAAGVWWVLYSACCFLKAWRSISHEQFLRHSSWLHALGWGVPSTVTIACLVLRKVEADELTSTCYAGGNDAISLVRWVIVPQFLFLIVGGTFVICSFAVCWRSRSSLVRQSLHHMHVDVSAARVGVMGVLYMVPGASLLAISFYELKNRSRWRNEFILNPLLPSRPSIEVYMLKIFMCVAPGLFIGIFLVNSKVLDSWKRLWKRWVKSKRSKNPSDYSLRGGLPLMAAAVAEKSGNANSCHHLPRGAAEYMVQLPPINDNHQSTLVRANPGPENKKMQYKQGRMVKHGPETRI